MLRKTLIVIISVFIISCAYADVEPDIELHKIIGGLYSLGAAVDLNNNINPDIGQIEKYFVNAPENVQLSRVKNSIWVGVSVGKYSSARNYLRSHAVELGITESPNGYEWMGGSYAWMKIAEVTKDKLIPVNFIASEGDGFIFFSTSDQSSWWQANPNFTVQASREILNRYGVSQPDLHSPKGTRVSIYDSVKPAEVGKLEKMHVGRKKNSFDVELEIGDIIFDPIPNRPRD